MSSNSRKDPCHQSPRSSSATTRNTRIAQSLPNFEPRTGVREGLDCGSPLPLSPATSSNSSRSAVTKRPEATSARHSHPPAHQHARTSTQLRCPSWQRSGWCLLKLSARASQPRASRWLGSLHSRSLPCSDTPPCGRGWRPGCCARWGRRSDSNNRDSRVVYGMSQCS